MPRGIVWGLVVGLVSVASGCGLAQDDVPSVNGEADSLSVERIRVPDHWGRGCGKAASTDPGDLRANRVVARCAPGSPAAEPLPGPAAVRVAVGAPTENIAPLLLADRLGEFAAENLSVELVSIADPAEAYAALADGEVDVVAGDIHAAFLDTVTQGAGPRWALGGSVPSAAGDTATPQAGLWLEPGALERAEQWTDLEGHRVVVDDGIAGAVVYPIHNLLRQRNTSLNAVRVEQALGDEAARRLLDGEVAAAWLESPHWRPVAARGVHQLVTTRPPIEPIDGMVFAGPLLDAARQRDVGVAFSRAIIRTINTYLAANYGNDPDVIAALAEVTGVEDDALGDPPLVFDWELRDGTLERMQRALIQLGAVTFEQRVEDRRFVDRSLYQEAVEGSPTGELATRRGGAGAYDQLQG